MIPLPHARVHGPSDQQHTIHKYCRGGWNIAFRRLPHHLSAEPRMPGEIRANTDLANETIYISTICSFHVSLYPHSRRKCKPLWTPNEYGQETKQITKKNTGFKAARQSPCVESHKSFSDTHGWYRTRVQFAKPPILANNNPVLKGVKQLIICMTS